MRPKRKPQGGDDSGFHDKRTIGRRGGGSFTDQGGKPKLLIPGKISKKNKVLNRKEYR